MLPIQWRQVDLRVGEVRLDPDTTKNREGRVFFLTPELSLERIDAQAPLAHEQREAFGPTARDVGEDQCRGEAARHALAAVHDEVGLDIQRGAGASG